MEGHGFSKRAAVDSNSKVGFAIYISIFRKQTFDFRRWFKNCPQELHTCCGRLYSVERRALSKYRGSDHENQLISDEFLVDYFR